MSARPDAVVDGCPGPAPLGRRILAQARFETGVLLRNGEQLLVALVLPTLALVLLINVSLGGLGDSPITTVAPGVLALAIVSTAFTGQAIQTAFDRRYGVLRMLATTPVGTDGLLAGKAVAITAVTVVQTIVLGLVAVALGWRPDALGILVTPVSAALGVWVFVALALLLAGAMRAEAVLAVANLVWVLLAGAGGLLLPGELTFGISEDPVWWLPSGALGNAFREALESGTVPLVPWLVLVVWGIALSAVVVRTFRWRD